MLAQFHSALRQGWRFRSFHGLMQAFNPVAIMPKPLPPKLTPTIILESTRLTHKCDRIADWPQANDLLGLYD